MQVQDKTELEILTFLGKSLRAKQTKGVTLKLITVVDVRVKVAIGCFNRM